jgi:hypothetical protein
MKRNDEQHAEVPPDAHPNPTTLTVSPSVSPHGAPALVPEHTASHADTVTILIEGGGFSFNDVFPMGSPSLAAENGRAIATFALSLVAPRRRRSPGRTVEK